MIKRIAAIFLITLNEILGFIGYWIIEFAWGLGQRSNERNYPRIPILWRYLAKYNDRCPEDFGQYDDWLKHQPSAYRFLMEPFYCFLHDASCKVHIPYSEWAMKLLRKWGFAIKFQWRTLDEEELTIPDPDKRFASPKSYELILSPLYKWGFVDPNHSIVDLGVIEERSVAHVEWLPTYDTYTRWMEERP